MPYTKRQAKFIRGFIIVAIILIAGGGAILAILGIG